MEKMIVENVKMQKKTSSNVYSKKKGLVCKRGQMADILGGFQRVIGWFLDVVPAPIKVLIFLLFLLLIGSLFGFFLNASGQWCDTAGNEYSTGSFSFFTNFNLLLKMPSNEDINSEFIDPEDYQHSVLECSSLFETFQDWKVKYPNGTIGILQEDEYLFHDSGKCTNCVNVIEVYNSFFGLNTPFTEKYCFDDIVYPKSYDDKTWFQKLTCGETSSSTVIAPSCDIPEGYYYDRVLDLFVCDDVLCEVDNNSVNTIGKRWNLLLRQKGAKLNPPSVYGEKDYRNALAVECDAGDVNPKLRVFGIEVFNYKIWLFLFLLGALLWALFKLKR